MPITLETRPVDANAVYIPMILIQTGINNGKLQTSCQLTLADARVDEKGEGWESGGRVRAFYIPDVMNLEEDLKQLSLQVTDLFTGIVELAGALNSIRKVL